MFLLRIGMRNQGRTVAFVLKAKIDEAPVCEHRDGESRYGNERSLVIQRRRQERACFGKESGSLLRGFSFRAGGVGTNEFFSLFLDPSSFGDVVSSKDYVIVAQQGLGPCDQSRRTILRRPIV